MRIKIFTRKSEMFVIDDVDSYATHNCGPGILSIRHGGSNIEYFRLGYIDHWIVENWGMNDENSDVSGNMYQPMD